MNKPPRMSGNLTAKEALRLMEGSEYQDRFHSRLREHIVIDCPKLRDTVNKDMPVNAQVKQINLLIEDAIANLNAHGQSFETMPTYHFFKAIKNELTRMENEIATGRSAVIKRSKAGSNSHHLL